MDACIIVHKPKPDSPCQDFKDPIFLGNWLLWQALCHVGYQQVVEQGDRAVEYELETLDVTAVQ
jgi:hypothetical protein